MYTLYYRKVFKDDKNQLKIIINTDLLYLSAAFNTPSRVSILETCRSDII